MKVKIGVVFIAFFIGAPIYAMAKKDRSDAPVQYLPGEYKAPEPRYQGKQKSPHVSGVVEERPPKIPRKKRWQIQALDARQPVAGQGKHFLEKTFNEKELILSPDNEPPGKFSKKRVYYEKSRRDLLDKIRYYSRHAYGLYFYKDMARYSHDSSDFDQVFRDGDDTEAAIIGRLKYHNFFYNHKILQLAWGVQFGVGHNAGKPINSNTGESISPKVKLWTFPLDASIQMEYPLSRFFKLSVSGGPSLMVLLQHRKDLPEGDDRKDLRQFGYGGFGAFEFKIAFSEWIKKTMSDAFYGHRTTRYLLSAGVRYQYYSGFKENITIDGIVLGAGFTVEFM